MTKLWWAQIKSVIRLEIKKTLFARRGLWIYILALLPLLLFTAHTVLTSHQRARSRQLAIGNEKALTYQDLLAIKTGMMSQEVITQLGKPPIRFHWNEQRPLKSGEGEVIHHENYHYSDGANDLYIDFADGKASNVHIREGYNLAQDSVVFAGVFQFFYLRLGIFFGCLGIFMNLFRGEILDKSLHFYFLAPIRRDVLMVGKFLAGLLATCTIFVTSRRAGFVPRSIQLIPRPTPLPTGMRGWLDTFANPFSAALPCEERDGFLDEVTALLKPVLCDTNGKWTADYTRLRFAAIKP
jgi:hypothetical protein